MNTDKAVWKDCHHLRLILLGLLATTLTACSWVGVLATEGPLLLTERRGLDSFTLVADLPDNFGLSVTGWYGPVDKNGLNCQVTNLHNNKQQARELGKRFDIPINAEAKSTSRTIPLTYYVGTCKLRLGKVEMEIDGRYGEQPWQKTYADAIFYIHKRTPEDEQNFDNNSTRQVDAQCTWLFQQSKAKSRLGEVSKLLICKGAGANLQYDQLAGKTVKLAIQVNPEERPSVRNRWIKGDSGWKPCLGTEKSDRCQQPPIFKTFLMNGQTCTVYPGCTE
ncbi:hypothetical protein CQ006_27775 [Pseudomonas cedrina]|uniref:Lipoprotein n=1 Tax=Pseudomonas cedrina TaxID=651740 RepID=A0A2S9D3E1_PSECE|nr:hypothetical protein CLM72_10945 [Pseudomonas sp. MYb193]PRB87272.1 hypothetical protein CQ006_27775 [Pseudomonas cedrina]